MEKPQLERRETIVAGIILAAAGAALYARKDGKLFHARSYPAGSVIIDILHDSKEKSTRIGAKLISLHPLNFEITPAEHTDSELDAVQELSEIAIEQQNNPLQQA